MEFPEPLAEVFCRMVDLEAETLGQMILADTALQLLEDTWLIRAHEGS